MLNHLREMIERPVKGRWSLDKKIKLDLVN
jgi:hypothetical protein